ncbi:TPA: hypothetical protein ACSTJ0_000267 [Serratia fonticola]|uniref:hypothetical protein n=1 Tax=Serratia fonticola TaxID=47917 RepID=UPI0021B7D8B7|nr:hypothetical protein [Serratia fonticola]
MQEEGGWVIIEIDLFPQGEGAAPSAWIARAASESVVQKEGGWVIIEIDLFP